MNVIRNTEVGDLANLANQLKTKARYILHASSLNDYIKANMIPRGLRIQKVHAMFRDDEAFGANSQYSYDLMLLIMEQSMAIVHGSSPWQ